jgi:AraC-like DNA-binding protein
MGGSSLLTFQVFFIHFGTLICLLYVLTELVTQRRRSNTSMILVCLAAAVIQIHVGLIADGIYLTLIASVYPLALLLPLAVFLMGPLLLQTGFQMLAAVYPRKVSRMLYIPALLTAAALAASLFWGVFSPQFEQVFREDIYRSIQLREVVWYNLWIAAAIVHGTACIVWLLVLNYLAGSRHGIALTGLANLSLLSLLLVFVVLALGWFGNSALLFRLGGVLITAVILATFLISARYPDFFFSRSLPSPASADKKRPLEELVDLDALASRLDKVMREQNLFRENLKLSRLADAVEIPPYLLSRYLNEVLGRNFTDYTNAFRVELAQRMLREEPDRTILEICLECGFTNKTSFNSHFLKKTGCTPSQYRKKVQ